MSVPIDDFWKLTGESQLIPVEQYRELKMRFRHLRGAEGRANSRAAASWLINQRVLTTYQAQVLLSGRSGPFTFGDYRVSNRLPSPLGIRRFNGVHLPTNHRLLIHFWPHSADQWTAALSLAQRHITLTHSNLDRCYETIESAGQRIALTEDAEGATVSELIQIKSKRPSVMDSVRIAHQVALALQQLHNSQLVHGYLTPEDILIAASGHAKLRRYPIAQLTPLDVDSPDPKQRLLRQAEYLAPELFRSNQPPDQLADIYALGCILYEMLNGSVPFPGGSLSEKMQRHASQPIESLEAVPSLPKGLAEVVSFMMAKKPSLRYQSVAEVAQKLEAFLGSAAHTTPPRPKPTEPYYLAHINKQSKQIPKHLQSPVDLPVDPPAAPVPVEPVAAHIGAEPEASTPPAIGIETVSVEGRPSRSRRSTGPLALGSAAIVIVISVLVLVISLGGGPGDDTAGRVHHDSSAISSDLRQRTNVDSANASGSASDTNVGDDGQTLWASPTDGSPISVEYAPPASQCFLYVRPREILQTSDGPAVLKALGPRFDALQAQFSREMGLSLEQVESLLAAFVPQDTQQPRVTFVMRLTQASVNELSRRAKATEPSDGGRRLKFDTAQAFLPTADPSIAIAGSAQDIQEVIERSGQPPLLKRQVEQLRLMTDSKRHLTVLLDPHFLAADGRGTFVGEFTQLREPILSFLGDQIEAASLSVHLDDTFYGELLLTSTLDQDPYSLAAACKSRLKELPETVNSLLGKIVIERFWQPLAIRFPLMINFLHQQTRIGVVDRCAMVNFALPEYSAHNLVLASVLAVEAAAISQGETTTPTAPQMLDWDPILAHRIDLAIPQESLEVTMLELANSVNESLPEAEFKIVIVGDALELDGITRNQQIRDVNLTNRSVNEILTELVRRANPTPAERLTSPEQKLLWVPDRGGEAAGRTVFITTRAAATRKGYPIPQQFLENSPQP